MTENSSVGPGSWDRSLARRLFEGTLRWGAIVAALAAVALVLTTSYDVANRGITGGSVPGLLDLNQTLLIVIVFLAIPWGERLGVHVRMTLVTNYLPNGIARVCRIVAYVLSTLIMFWFAYASVIRAIDSTSRAEAQLGLIHWPVWPARWVIAVGFLLVAIQCAIKIYDAALGRPLEIDEAAEALSQAEEIARQQETLTAGPLDGTSKMSRGA